MLVWVTFEAENKTLGIDRDIFNRPETLILQKLMSAQFNWGGKPCVSSENQEEARLYWHLNLRLCMEFWIGAGFIITFLHLLKILEWVVCTYIVSELHWILSWGTYGMPKRNMCGRYPFSLATHKMGWRLYRTCRIVLVDLKQSPSWFCICWNQGQYHNW